LIIDVSIFLDGDDDDDDIPPVIFSTGELFIVCPGILAAFHQNTSIVIIRPYNGEIHPIVTLILKRNQMLKHADSLLLAVDNTRTVNTPRIHSKSGLWYKVFAKMTARPTNNSNMMNSNDYLANTGGTMIGASAIFKILQNRPPMLDFPRAQPPAVVVVAAAAAAAMPPPPPVHDRPYAAIAQDGGASDNS
jgi:hypothetical protein